MKKQEEKEIQVSLIGWGAALLFGLVSFLVVSIFVYCVLELLLR